MAGSRFALLIANAEYENPALGKLNAPPHDVRALEAVLARSEIGEYQSTVLVDENKSTVERAIDRLLTDSDRDDTVLIFFAGHGLKRDNGKLYFAVSDTEPKHLGATAISAGWLVEQMQESRVRFQIVLLDCCFGGAFSRGHVFRAGEDARVESGIALEIPELKNSGRGQVVITSADAMQFAFEEDLLKEGEPPSSHFTSVLVEGLKSGRADINDDGVVTIDELMTYLESGLAGSPQRPTKWIFGAASGDLLFAKNPKGKESRDANQARIKKIREHVDRIRERFSRPGPVPPTELQYLARPLTRYAMALTSFAIVDELLRDTDSGDSRDAAVFSAANIIHDRYALDYYDSLVRLIRPDRPVRPAAMWRVLRAIKRLLSHQELKLSELQREQLFQALRNAKFYDEKPGRRFSEHTIPKKIFDIASLGKTGLSKRLSQIFTADQYNELQQSTGKRLRSRE